VVRKCAIRYAVCKIHQRRSRDARDGSAQRQKRQTGYLIRVVARQNEKAAAKLDKVIETLKAARPDYVSVTFGAGGSTREGSFELLDKLKNQVGFQVVAYLAGVGLGTGALAGCLDRFASLDIGTLFVIRGDPPTWDENYEPHPEALSHASEILAFVKKRSDLCLGCAGYPEGHIEAASKEQDLENLARKVEQGADYIVTQYCYDNRYFFDFRKRARAMGIKVPIFAGIMPIYTIKLMENLAKICGATITDPLRQELAQLDIEDKKAVSQFGVDFATRQCRQLLEQGVDGLHFYTMNRGKTIESVLTNLRSDGLLD
jgi:methylenetetrahydrofolate reductase (NADPH)